MRKLVFAVGAATLVAGLLQAEVPTTGGTFKWEDYLGSSGRVDARPSSLTGTQIWIVQKAHLALSPFYPGTPDPTADYWQIYTGEALKVTGTNFRVMKGNVVFENAVTSATTENYIGYTGAAKLILRNGGSLTATSQGIRIGNVYEGGTAGTGTIFMETPSMLCGAGQWIDIGTTLPGALWMDGGTVSLTNNVLYVSDGADGYLRQNGGTVSLRGDNGNTLELGYGTKYGSIHLSGGTFTSRKTGYPSNPYVLMGKSTGTVDFYADGGKMSLPNERVAIGYWGSGTPGTVRFTVDGSAEIDVGLLAFGINADVAGKAILNLNGGHLVTQRGCAEYGKVNPIRQVNFDGGTFQGVSGGGLSSYPTTVYPKGGTIEVKTSRSDINSALRLATGYGVGAITLTNPGSGYVTAPEITISGGSGSGATAYAVMNKDRTIEKVVVTCRGEGYAENDTLTVAFASTTGSGAAATVTLAANGTGALRKTGAGTWHQVNDSAFDGDIVVEEGRIAVDNAAFTSLAHLYVENGGGVNAGRSLETGVVRESAVNRVDFRDGMGYLSTYGDSGIAKLTVGTLTLDHALANVQYTNDLQLALTDTALTATSSSASPIVHGLVYQHMDASNYRSPSLFERGEDGTLSLIKTTSTPSPDANYCPSASVSSANAPEVSSLNSAILPLSPAVDVYLKNTGLLEIKSGMIVCRRPQEDVIRLAVTGGGALTTRAPGGMMIYADMKEVARRSYSAAHDNVVNVGRWRRIYGPFADPDGSTPMALTVAGEKQNRPERGAVAWLLDNDTYTGGLVLINGGAVVSGERNLGGRVTAVGYCSLSIYNQTFNISDKTPFELRKDSALLFSPCYGNQGNTIASPLSGTGDLLTSDIDRSGYAMAFTGDHSAFTGDYYVMGHARIAPEAFSSQAGICLADGTNGVGVIETSGGFERPFGTGTGMVCWKRHRSMPAAYGLKGGFAAKGGALTVNLGGEGAPLVSGSDYLPADAVIQLQSQYADSALTFENGIDLNGKTQAISVWNGKTAKLTGELKDSVGGGALKVTGGGTLVYGGTINVTIDENGVVGEPLAVEGDLTLDGAKIVISDPDDCLKTFSGRKFPVFSVTGKLSGKFAYEIADGRWRIKTTSTGAVLDEWPGVLLIVR